MSSISSFLSLRDRLTGLENHRKSLIQSYQQSELSLHSLKKAPNSQLGEIEKTLCWRSNMVTRQPLVKNAQKSDILSHFPTICEAPTVVVFFSMRMVFYLSRLL